MDDLQEFRSVVPAERSEKIFRDIIKKQEAGEIRTEAQLREELEKQINLVNERGRVTFEIPVPPGQIVASEVMADFFKMISTDIDILFVEADSTDEILTRQAKVINAQIQSLRFAMGQLKAESIQKKIRIKPGAGFTTILRDSFDRGYSDLAGRAEVPYDLFKDTRTSIDVAKAEDIPIQADARVEGIGKKLILPAVSNKNIGFKSINVTNIEDTSIGTNTTDVTWPTVVANLTDVEFPNPGYTWLATARLLDPDTIFYALSNSSIGIVPVKLTNYGFNIPLDATITKIEVLLKAGGEGIAETRAITVQLTKDGSNLVGNTKTQTHNQIIPSSNVTANELVYDNGLWGTAWTPAEINSPTFGATFVLAGVGTYPDDLVGVRYANIRVTYHTRPTNAKIDVDNIYPESNTIDGQLDTFWSHTVGHKWPLVGTPTVNVTRVQGVSGLNPDVSFSNLNDLRAHDYYVKVVGWSGIYPVITSLITPESYVGPICQYDMKTGCYWKYDQQYSPNCINANCSRYSVDTTTVISGNAVAIEDGYGYDTGATINWESYSGLSVGTTFKISNKPSGTVGLVTELDLILTTPSYINWIELDPVADAPFSITDIEYIKPTESGRHSVINSVINVEEKVRIDIPRIEVERIFVTINQSNYRKSKIVTNPKNTAINQIETIKSSVTDPTPEDVASVDLPILMEEFVRNPDVKELFVQSNWTPEVNDGYFYQVGLFEIDCGLSSYAENAIAISKERRVRTPTMFGVQANIEQGIDIAVEGADVGTFEFSIVKLNFDTQGSLINIQDFPIPIVSSGVITERLFLDENNTGKLRFVAESVSSIENLSTSLDISSDDYVLTTTSETAPTSAVNISNNTISSSNVLIVKYVPKYGVYLDNDKALMLENNDNYQLSISEVQSIVTSTSEIFNRKIDYSDVYTRIIIRRNDNDSFNTPKLRDYHLLISEQDPNRFFV